MRQNNLQLVQAENPRQQAPGPRSVLLTMSFEVGGKTNFDQTKNRNIHFLGPKKRGLNGVFAPKTLTR